MAVDRVPQSKLLASVKPNWLEGCLQKMTSWPTIGLSSYDIIILHIYYIRYIRYPSLLGLTQIYLRASSYHLLQLCWHTIIPLWCKPVVIGNNTFLFVDGADWESQPLQVCMCIECRQVKCRYSFFRHTQKISQ